MEAVIEGAARWGVGPDTNYPALVLDGTEPLGDTLSQPLIAVGPGPFEVLPAPLSLHLYDPSPEELWTAIIALAGGFLPSGQGVRSPEAQDESRSGRPRLHQETALTVRELEVLEYVARGLPNKGIAAELDISMSTVKFHLVNLMTKLNAHNRAELVMEGAREGYLNV
jgi:DNA-binding CsgD family transcriptional regulator